MCTRTSKNTSSVMSRRGASLPSSSLRSTCLPLSLPSPFVFKSLETLLYLRMRNHRLTFGFIGVERSMASGRGEVYEQPSGAIADLIGEHRRAVATRVQIDAF